MRQDRLARPAPWTALGFVDSVDRAAHADDLDNFVLRQIASYRVVGHIGWIEHDVPQCGYCQSGMIMAVAALLEEKPKPTDADITNICRCGTYQQARTAIHAAANA
jgi:[2Fe-2S] binding domain